MPLIKWSTATLKDDWYEPSKGHGGGQIRMKVTYVYVVGVDIIRAGVCKQRVELDSMSII